MLTPARLSLAFTLTSLFATGCGEAGAQDVVELTPPCASTENGIWESNPWISDADGCSFLPYNGSTSYRVAHGLGRVPRSVEVYVAFTEDGAACAMAPGDMARILYVDSDAVVIENQTEANLFFRLVLE